MINIVEKARIFATAAHAATGQVRKYTFEPYIVHPAEVATIVAEFGGTEAMIAAAWLHDVIEDTKITIDIINSEFGDEVSTLVYSLTDISRPEDGNRAVRKGIDRAHIAAASSEAQTIKLADLISNTYSILNNDTKFAQVYLAEKAELLKVMTKANPHLYSLALAQINL